MFALSSSKERKHRGFLLVQRFILSAPANNISTILGKNCIRCLANQHAQEERYLHSIAGRTLRTLQDRVRSEPRAVLPMLQSIIKLHGYANFDHLTKGKTLENLFRCVPLELLKDVVKNLALVLVSPGTGEAKLASSKRQILADYLLMIVRSLPVPSSEDMLKLHRDAVGSILRLLVRLAYFDLYISPDDGTVSKPEPSITQDNRQTFRSRILSCLGHLVSKDPDPAYHPYEVVLDIQGRSATDHKPLFKADEEVRRCIERSWKALLKIHSKVESKGRADTPTHNALELLFSLTIIQAYSGEPDAVNILEELQGCYKSLLKGKPAAKQDSGSSALMDIILSLISKPSLLFRRLSQQVFTSFAPRIGEDDLGSMIRVRTVELRRGLLLTRSRSLKLERIWQGSKSYLNRSPMIST